MSIREIKKFNEPILYQKVKPVEKVTLETKNLIQDLKDTLLASKGVGLAANQIGVPLRVLVIDLKSDSSSQEPRASPRTKLGAGQESQERILTLINPKIVASRGREIAEEGCLSFPGLYLKIKRASRIKVEALDLQEKSIVIESEGLPARVIQHEIDHLEGKVFIDRLSFWKRWKIKRELTRIMKEKTNLHE